MSPTSIACAALHHLSPTSGWRCIPGPGTYCARTNDEVPSRLGAAVAATSKSEKAKTAAVVVPAGASPEAVEGLVSSLLAAMYHDTRFKSGDGLWRGEREGGREGKED